MIDGDRDLENMAPLPGQCSQVLPAARRVLADTPPSLVSVDE